MASHDTQWVVDGSGELVAFAHPFKEVGEAEAQRAEEVEVQIRSSKMRIEGEFLNIAEKLDHFDSQRLYLGRGYETMKDWAESPEVELSWRLAQDLLRIQREVVPLLVDHFEGDRTFALASLLRAGVSKARLLLPLLRDPDITAEQFVEILLTATQMPYRALANEVKALQGKERAIEDRSPAVFMATVREGDAYDTVKVVCSDGVETYDVGKLTIKKVHMPRWSQRFGDLLRYEER